MAKPELTPDVSELGLTTPESPPVAGFFCEFLVGNKKTRESLQAGFPQRSGGN